MASNNSNNNNQRGGNTNQANNPHQSYLEQLTQRKAEAEAELASYDTFLEEIQAQMVDGVAGAMEELGLQDNPYAWQRATAHLLSAISPDLFQTSLL